MLERKSINLGVAAVADNQPFLVIKPANTTRDRAHRGLNDAPAPPVSRYELEGQPRQRHAKWSPRLITVGRSGRRSALCDWIPTRVSLPTMA